MTMRPDDSILDAVVTLACRDYLRYRTLAERVRSICEEVASDNLVRCTTQHRIKSTDRLRRKLEIWREKGKLDGLMSAEAVAGRVGDMAAVRVTTYLHRDVERMREKLAGPLSIRSKETKGGNGQLYRAVHLDVALPEGEGKGPEDASLKGLCCEIQICTLLAHVYSEVEHDLRYKPMSGSLSEEELLLLDALGHLAHSGDNLILSLIQRTEARIRSEAAQSPVIGAAPEAVDVMAALAPDLGFLAAPSDNAGPVLRLLAAIGMRSVTQIREAALQDNPEARMRMLMDRLASGQGSATERLGTLGSPFNPDSADGLLMLAVHAMPDQVRSYLDSRGPGRPPREVALARQFLERFASLPDPTAKERAGVIA